MTINDEDRDRILQMVAYIKMMNYQAKQTMMDSSNWRKLLEILDDANAICVGIVNSLNDENKPNVNP